MKILLAIVLVFLFKMSTAQSLDLLEKKLTNGGHQRWTVTEIDGDSQNGFCADQVYDFYEKNQNSYRTTCSNKQIKETLRWEVANDNYRNYITLSNVNNQNAVKYEIQFVQKNNRILLRLRTLELENLKQTTDYYLQEIGD